MSYIECTIKLEPFRPWNEIVVAQLGEIDFESFTENEPESELKAFIVESDFNENEVIQALELFQDLKYSIIVKRIEKENWNKKWEENFDAVEVGNFCYVRAPFHEMKKEFEHEIIIEPKMSFGTGHHQTTQMMIELMSKIDFQQKSVLDMGSGTGILAILAKRMGAREVTAIDIEEWAYSNMIENFDRNNVDVEAYHGGIEHINSGSKKYDVIIANINKNILLQQFESYDSHLNSGGHLLLSGFYQSDVSDLVAADEISHYQITNQLDKEGWCGLHLKK